MRHRPTVITTQHLFAAWDLWERYYRPHAQAVFDRAGPADGDRQGKHKARQHARRVIGWIRARGVKEVSREEVRREALSQRVNAAGADEVILALEQAGVLREVEVDEDYPSPGRPARRWQVNPALLAKPAAQIAESPSLPSAAGEVSPSYDACPERSRRDGGVGSLGSSPSAESFAQIAEKQTSARLEGRGRRGWGNASGPHPTSCSHSCADGLAKMIKRLAGPRTSRSASSSSIRGHERTWRSALPGESCSSERGRPARSDS